MHPILFEIPGLGSYNSYGTLILIAGLIIGPGLFWDLRRRGIEWLMLLDFYIVLVVGCWLGGRMIDIATRPGFFLQHPQSLFDLNEGFIFYGSVLGVFVGFIWLARRYRRPLGEICDLLATWMAFSHAIGRLGCWFAGCCYGSPTVVPTRLAAEFPAESVAYREGLVPHAGATTVGLHPVQLFESAALLLLFTCLLTLRVRRGIERPWTQAARWAVGYGIVRMVTEIFRGDGSRGFVFEIRWPWLMEHLNLPTSQPVALSTSQTIGLFLIGLGSWALIRRRRQARSTAGA